MTESNPKLWGKSKVDPRIDAIEKILQTAYAENLITEPRYKKLVGQVPNMIAMYDLTVKSQNETERYERENPLRNAGIAPRGSPQFLAPPTKVSVIDGSILTPDNFIGLYLMNSLFLPFDTADKIRDKLNFITIDKLLSI